MPRRTRLETVASFRADMERLLDIVSQLSEEERGRTIYGDWTIKDVLAHIAAWDRALVRGLDELLAGRRPAFADYREADFNAQVVSDSRETPFDAVLAEAKEAHETLTRRITALTDEEWERSSAYRWGNLTPMTAGSLFDYSYKGETHYGGHTKEIEAWTAD